MKIRELAWFLVTLHSVVAFGADTAGPKLVSASVSESGSTNLIVVTVSERLSYSTVIDIKNYAITLLGTTNRVPISTALSIPGNPPLHPTRIILRVATNNWHLGGVSNYYITVNHLQDLSGNTIAPDSRIGLTWQCSAMVVLPASAEWRYYTGWCSEPDILQQPWMSPGFVESSCWAEGNGPFWSGFSPPADCFGTPVNELPVRSTLFRTEFVCPAEYAADGFLMAESLLTGGGAVYYLNGMEMGRIELCPAPAPFPPECQVLHAIAPPMCATYGFGVTNLVAGTNLLAVRIFSNAGYIAFGVRLSAIRLITGPLPDEDLPAIRIAPLSTNAARLSWVGSGYALETSTNLLSGWVEVPDMSNPYVISAFSNPPRFFRLRK